MRCDHRDTDSFGRIVGVCVIGETDLNEALVDEGLAVAYRQFSWKYVLNEYRARWNEKGLWAGSFQMQWEFRGNYPVDVPKNSW